MLFLDISKAFDPINHKILLGKLKHIGLSARSLRCFKSYLRVYKWRSIWDLTLSTWVCRKGSLWTGLLSSGELGRAKSEKACRQTFWTAVCCFRASILEAENELRLRPRKNRFFQRFNRVFSNSPRRSALNPSFLSGNSFSLTKSLSCRWKSYRTQEAWQTDFGLGWAVQFRLFVYFLNHPPSP